MNKPSTPPVLLDVMMNGRFLCQLRYNKRGFPRVINGKVFEVYNYNDLQAFVEEQRPSLKGKSYIIKFATQKVFTY